MLHRINGNIIFNNKNIESYADNIDFNILDENITINMFDKEDRIKIKESRWQLLKNLE